jgi:hypothetical protein
MNQIVQTSGFRKRVALGVADDEPSAGELRHQPIQRQVAVGLVNRVAMDPSRCASARTLGALIRLEPSVPIRKTT